MDVNVEVNMDVDVAVYWFDAQRKTTLAGGGSYLQELSRLRGAKECPPA